MRIDCYKRLSTKLLSTEATPAIYIASCSLRLYRPIRPIGPNRPKGPLLIYYMTMILIYSLLISYIQALGYTLAYVRNTIPFLARLS